MSDIYNGIIAQLDLLEEFYSLNLKEKSYIIKIKKGLKELIKLYEKDMENGYIFKSGLSDWLIRNM